MPEDTPAYTSTTLPQALIVLDDLETDLRALRREPTFPAATDPATRAAADGLRADLEHRLTPAMPDDPRIARIAAEVDLLMVGVSDPGAARRVNDPSSYTRGLRRAAERALQYIGSAESHAALARVDAQGNEDALEDWVQPCADIMIAVCDAIQANSGVDEYEQTDHPFTYRLYGAFDSVVCSVIDSSKALRELDERLDNDPPHTPHSAHAAVAAVLAAPQPTTDSAQPAPGTEPAADPAADPATTDAGL